MFDRRGVDRGYRAGGNTEGLNDDANSGVFIRLLGSEVCAPAIVLQYGSGVVIPGDCASQPRALGSFFETTPES
jgi:hypothetical protein